MVGFVGHVPSGVPKFWAPSQPVGPDLSPTVGWQGGSRPGPLVTRVALCMALCAPPPLPPQVSSAGWAQAFPQPQKPKWIWDVNQGWVPQAPAVAAAPAVPTFDGQQAEPVFGRPVFYQASATLPPQAPAAAVVTPTISWLQPFSIPSSLLRRIDTNAALAWVPQPSFNAATPANLEWLRPFDQPRQPARIAAQSSVDVLAPSAPNLAWLQPLSVRFAQRPVYDLNSGYVAQPPPAATPTPSTLGWLQPFPTKTVPRPLYDLNQRWVPQVPAAVVATPPISWLQSLSVPQRDQIVFDTILSPFGVPTAALSASAQADSPQPGPVFTRRALYQAYATLPPQAQGLSPVITPLGAGSQQPGPVFSKRALYQAFATLPPQAPAVFVAAPSFGWFQQLTAPTRQTVVFNTVILPFTLPDISTWGWFQPFATPPQPKRLWDVNSGWVPQVPSAATPTPSIYWFQPLGTPRQPVRLWDVNSGFTPQAAPTFTPTPTDLGWLQPFPVPPQPPRRPVFNEVYVPQNVGGTTPVVVVDSGTILQPHSFTRKRWRELQELIAAEEAALAKANALRKNTERRPLRAAALAADNAIAAAWSEGESDRLNAELVATAKALREAMRATTVAEAAKDAHRVITMSRAIVEGKGRRLEEEEEEEMVFILANL